MSFGFDVSPVSFDAYACDAPETWTARLPGNVTEAKQVLAKQRADLEVARQALLLASNRLQSFVESSLGALTFRQTLHADEDSFRSEPPSDRMDASYDDVPFASLTPAKDSSWSEPSLDLMGAVYDYGPLASLRTGEDSFWPEPPLHRKDAIYDDFDFSRPRTNPRDELLRLIQEALKWLIEGVRVQTFLGGTLLATTWVGQSSRWETTWHHSAAPEEMALHKGVLSLALDSLLHSVDLETTIFDGAIALAPLLATPGGIFLSVSAVRRFVERFVAEGAEPGSSEKSGNLFESA